MLHLVCVLCITHFPPHNYSLNGEEITMGLAGPGGGREGREPLNGEPAEDGLDALPAGLPDPLGLLLLE